MNRATELAWVAGVIEGEGCFQAAARPAGRIDFAVSVTMNDKDVIERLARVTGVGRVRPRSYVQGQKKPLWRWSVNRRDDFGALCMTLYPLMGERRKAKILDCLQVWRHAKPGTGRGSWLRPRLTAKTA